MIPELLALLVSYLVGSVPTGLLVARAGAGIDIREHGSKNIGMTNVWRVCGWKLGLTTFLIDVAKAFAAVWFLPQLLGGGVLPHLAILCGLAVLVGNMFSVFMGLKGGKGVASSLGVFLALAPVPILICFVAFVVLVGATRYISVGSLAAAVLLPILVYMFHGAGVLLVVVSIISVLVIWKHRANIRRLASGTESKFGARKAA